MPQLNKCVSSARLIGIVQAHRAFAYQGGPLPIDRQFVEVASQGRPPELRFRFASACAEGGCANWGANGCGIAAQISRSDRTSMSELPNCGIRPQCRLFPDRGVIRACAGLLRNCARLRRSAFFRNADCFSTIVAFRKRIDRQERHSPIVSPGTKKGNPNPNGSTGRCSCWECCGTAVGFGLASRSVL